MDQKKYCKEIFLKIDKIWLVILDYILFIKKKLKMCIFLMFFLLKLFNFFILNYLGEYLIKICVFGFYFKCYWIILIKISDNEWMRRFFCRVLIISNC